MNEEPLGPVIRREIRRRSLRTAASCACGEGDPLVLHAFADGAECARCAAIRKTARPTEGHHPAGRANSSLVCEIDANLHARFTDAQYDWPVETLVNRDRRPARRLAAFLRAFIDFCRIALPRLLHDLEQLVVWLESMDSNLEGGVA